MGSSFCPTDEDSTDGLSDSQSGRVLQPTAGCQHLAAERKRASEAAAQTQTKTYKTADKSILKPYVLTNPPGAIQPIVTKPVVMQPVVTQPVAAQLVAAQPAVA